MPFCMNCGKKLPDGAKFCFECGTRFGSVNQQPRIQIFEGVVHKCPNCGEVVSSFEVNCSLCGYEFRDTRVSSALDSFSSQLQSLETEKEKIDFIKSFPIPNNKEDILSFMNYAKSNFDTEYYASHLDVEDISDAWLAIIERCYQQAKYTLRGTSDLRDIKSDYLSIKGAINQQKAKNSAFSFIPYVLIIFGLILIISDINIGVILFGAGIIMLFTMKGSSNQTIDPKLKGYSSWNQEKKVGWIILNIFSLGIPAIVYSNKQKQEKLDSLNCYSEKTGFASWSAGAQVMWIILNIYTLGIPALIYSNRQKQNSIIRYESKRKGFSSWSAGLKLIWIILNIYTLGIPALIYYSKKK
ncbi:Double zinc ribbon [Ruminococcus flavefaciens]|uniref:Double zinc ribbon n=1 Tax=Ruminococcus flavefaciens TaxID=1265 RepID=A0A1H6ISK4_RUMFL|nr:zinc ribbon domain-containing protein [Ruminococcus flavefaciens]SEH50681.1 Double zinc ribbon [Ruminococcus flavefaciens]